MSSNGAVEMCDNHPQMKAIALCEVCGKPVCGDCAMTRNGKYFCDDVFHQIVGDRYSVFGESDNLFEIELTAKNLEANGVSSLWFNRKQYAVKNKTVLYVMKGSEEHAHSILQSLDLLDFISVNNNV